MCSTLNSSHCGSSNVGHGWSVMALRSVRSNSEYHSSFLHSFAKNYGPSYRCGWHLGGGSIVSVHHPVITELERLEGQHPLSPVINSERRRVCIHNILRWGAALLVQPWDPIFSWSLLHSTGMACYSSLRNKFPFRLLENRAPSYEQKETRRLP